MTASWAAAAEALAESARDLGFAVAATVAAAWQARCDPDATRPLVQAAHALTSGDALPRLWDRVPPCPSAGGYLAAAGEHEALAAVLARGAAGMEAACVADREDATAAYGRERQRAERAQARLSSGQPDAGAQADLEAACDAMRAFQQAIADCDAAMEVIAAARERLGYSLACLRRAEEGLAEAYDIPLQLVRDGGALPWSGDFLTGTGIPAERS